MSNGHPVCLSTKETDIIFKDAAKEILGHSVLCMSGCDLKRVPGTLRCEDLFNVSPCALNTDLRKLCVTMNTITVLRNSQDITGLYLVCEWALKERSRMLQTTVCTHAGHSENDLENKLTLELQNPFSDMSYHRLPDTYKVTLWNFGLMEPLNQIISDMVTYFFNWEENTFMRSSINSG